MEVAERIRIQSEALTVAERRVAEAILAAPDAVAFGTVADLARRSDVGAASVVRLAAKLGFDGYSDLQQCVRVDLAGQLRPAAERIRDTGTGTGDGHADAEVGNVRATLEGVSATDLAEVVARLSDLSRPVTVLSGVATAGVARQFATELGQLRPDVSVLAGSEVAVLRDIALLPVEATALVIDLRRYERWVLAAHRHLASRGIWSVALTDGFLSPLAGRSDVTFVVSARAVGPFDSHVGTLALLNLFVTEVAGRLQHTAGDRLAGIESVWRAHDALSDGR